MSFSLFNAAIVSSLAELNPTDHIVKTGRTKEKKLEKF